MTIQAPNPPPILIPEGAPFNADQRAWLNGFFAGILSLGAMPTQAGPEAMQVAAKAASDDDGAAPWHDPSMELDARMKLAEGRPLSRRLMAAMAQQDCGQCGYNCEDYATAISNSTEARLNLCVPGGKGTARKLKELFAEVGARPPSQASSATLSGTDATHADATPGRSREAPVEAAFVSRYRLNGAGSEKITNHIEIDLSASGLDYVVGDSLGVYAENDPTLVDQIIATIGADPGLAIGEKSLREILLNDVALAPAPDGLFQLISYLVSGARRVKAKALARGENPDGDAETLDVLEALRKFSPITPSAEAFVECLEALQPRLYSISSSMKANPGRVSLTVDAVQYDIEGRTRLGVASTYLGMRATTGAALRVYVQKAHGFALPADPSVPIIMVGPGTGVAPFRAFLQERRAVAATGPAWLFYGHQRSATDFFYKDEFDDFLKVGALTQLSLAWSRDGAEKVYVQDKMREQSAELFAWLEKGAHFYVCGDAKRMARDVERAVIDAVTLHGKASPEDAAAYVAALKNVGRYQADVY